MCKQSWWTLLGFEIRERWDAEEELQERPPVRPGLFFLSSLISGGFPGHSEPGWQIQYGDRGKRDCEPCSDPSVTTRWSKGKFPLWPGFPICKVGLMVAAESTPWALLERMNIRLPCSKFSINVHYFCPGSSSFAPQISFWNFLVAFRSHSYGEVCSLLWGIIFKPAQLGSWTQKLLQTTEATEGSALTILSLPGSASQNPWVLQDWGQRSKTQVTV